MSDVLPDCMMPDGGDPCEGLARIVAERDTLRAELEAERAKKTELRQERDKVRIEVANHARFAEQYRAKVAELVKMVGEQATEIGSLQAKVEVSNWPILDEWMEKAKNAEARAAGLERSLQRANGFHESAAEKAYNAEARLAEVERENGELREAATAALECLENNGFGKAYVIDLLRAALKGER